MDMKQKMQYIQTLKQTLKLNQKLLKSLDFLTDNIDDINKVIQDILETNPFLELKSSKNYDTCDLPYGRMVRTPSGGTGQRR